MATVDLSRKLSELHDVFSPSEGTRPAEEARDLVVDIAHICLKELPENELAFCCSELFNKDTGILKFLQKAVNKDEFSESKGQMLEFLYPFLKKYGQHLLDHVVDIKNTCLSLFTRDSSAKVKAKTFDVLVQVIKLTSRAPMANELDIQKMIEKYFISLTQPSKLSQTVKHGIYELLGVIAEVYPEVMLPYSVLYTYMLLFYFDLQ
ncbi:DNA-dependent protein kinase catalytic subunit-like [Amphiura filiformis]|uniref:DNA-dependent protein kinase catalytic subunit-like n=1 Tax=Amphiura filiformis TaxID=82378 RepID=UPI003B21C55B